MQRFYASWQDWDFEALSDMISTQPHSLVVGTDPDEWNGPDGLAIWKVQAQELGPITVRSTALTAYSCGSVGWIADQVLVTSGVQDAVCSVRITGVLAIECGQWRMFQMHASLGQANEQALGRVVTTRIEKIERSERLERPDVATASTPDGTSPSCSATSSRRPSCSSGSATRVSSAGSPGTTTSCVAPPKRIAVTS
jgi:hypothetical protein